MKEKTEKYCELQINEDLIEMLQDFIKEEYPDKTIEEVAQIAIYDFIRREGENE